MKSPSDLSLQLRRVEPELVAELDLGAGPRRRSAFIAALIRRALDDEKR